MAVSDEDIEECIVTYMKDLPPRGDTPTREGAIPFGGNGLRHHRIKIERLNGKRFHRPLFFTGSNNGAIAIPRQGTGCRRCSGQSPPQRKTLSLEARSNALQHRLLTAKKMAGASDIQ